MNKIITKQEFAEKIRPELKKNGKTIALCHGVFDLVHPGHIVHLKQASEIADVLVVSITASEYVRKGPGRPYFDDATRMNFLSAIEYVDYVMLSECFTVDDIIRAVEPDFYVKGEEYSSSENDITGKIDSERRLVEQHGGKMYFTTGQVFSSTRIINTMLDGLPEEVVSFMENFRYRHSMSEIRKIADNSAKLNILVIGDLIIDRYSYCIVHGLINKDAVYSSRLENTEDFAGGSAAVARHLASFAGKITLVAAVGNNDYSLSSLNMPDNIRTLFFESKERATIIKQKYLTHGGKRQEYRKYFGVHNIPRFPSYEEELHDKINDFLNSSIEDFDAVFLCDFGHGLLAPSTMNILQDRAKYLILNCQNNSANYGTNPITKYRRADLFCLDQQELFLAMPMYLGDEENALRELAKCLGCSKGCLTRGASGAAYIDGSNFMKCPAFSLHVKDTVGAGDSFYSVAGIYAAMGASMDIVTVMGNIGGALGANIIGNKEAVEKVNVLKYAATMMNV